VVHKRHVLRSVTWLWSKAIPGAYSSCGFNMTCLLYFIACDVLCIMYRILLIDGDRLYGSTLPYTILDVVVLLL
jgi:hypothetical protein